MDPQTREEKQKAMKLVSLSLWGAVFIFVVMAALFLFEVIPSSNPQFIGGGLLAFAVLDSVFIKFLMGKIHSGMDT